eukprot:g4052.t1
MSPSPPRPRRASSPTRRASSPTRLRRPSTSPPSPSTRQSRPAHTVTAVAPQAGSGGSGESGDGSITFANVKVTGEHGGGGSGGAEGWMSRKQRDLPYAGGSRDVMDVDTGLEAEGGLGGEGGQLRGRGGGEVGRDITTFSPYAARLGSGTSPEDEVGRTAARLEGLSFEHTNGHGGHGSGSGGGPEESSLQSPAKKHQGGNGPANANAASAASASGVGVARRMQFFHEGEGDAPLVPLVTQPLRLPPPVSESPEIAASTAAVVAVEPVIATDIPAGGFPSSCPSMQQQGRADGSTSTSTSMSSPPTVAMATEKRTLVVYPPECLLHMGVDDQENHQEKPRRLELLCGEKGALRRNAFQGLEWVDSSLIAPALITDLLRVHEYDYLLHIQDRCAGAPPSRAPTSHPGSCGGDDDDTLNGGKTAPLVSPDGKMGETAPPSTTTALTNASAFNAATSEETRARGPGRLGKGQEEYGLRFRADVGYVDVDTRVSRESYGAARMAAGAVILAVDRVVQGENPNAFVAVRPPGHHAGPSGSVPSSSFWKNPGMNSSGFCLLNSAAIGAAYARSRYGRSGEASRVAIVDIDIHHGNGTEEIVRCLRPMTMRLPLPPSWPPMTKTVYKPWLDEEDADNVFFGSVSLQDDHLFYPASGTEEERFDDNANIVNVSLSALGPPPGDEAKKRALTKTKLAELTNKAGNEFKRKCQGTLLARLKEFSPDLLIISAGFDGHVEDYYHYLSNEVYEWVTGALVDCCPSGRVVSVLEGGYSLEARVSRAKAAQQARANMKRTAKPGTAAAASTGAGGQASGASARPALRERRSRAATRGSAPSTSSQMSASAKNGPAPPPPLPSVGEPSASAAAAAAGVTAVKTMLPAVPVVVESTAPSLSSPPCSSEQVLDHSLCTVPGAAGTTAATAVVATGVVGGASVVVGGSGAAALREAGAKVVGVDNGSTSINTGGGPVKRASRKAKGSASTGVALAKDDGDAVLQAGDGGLVRGVVSHVTALMRSASSGQQQRHMHGLGVPHAAAVSG